MHRVTKKAKRYLLVGFGVYFFEVVVILIARALGCSAVVAVSISFWLGLFLSFILQKYFTFEDKRTEKKIMFSQVSAYGFLVLFNFIFTVFVTRQAGDHLPAVVSRTIALAITTLWNYYLYKTRIFNQDNLPLY